MTEHAARLVAAEAAKDAFERYLKPVLLRDQAALLNELWRVASDRNGVNADRLARMTSIAGAIRISNEMLESLQGEFSSLGELREQVRIAERVAGMSFEQRRYSDALS